MSVFRKLFIATALVATGLGVALLLGEPDRVRTAFDAAISPHAHHPTGGQVAGSQSVTPAASSAREQTPPLLAGSVQLVPESQAADLEPPNALPQAPALLSALESNTQSVVNRPLLSRMPVPASIASPLQATAGSARDSTVPAARLRDEAPRAIGNEPRSPSTVRRAPPITTNENEPLSRSRPIDPRISAAASSWDDVSSPSAPTPINNQHNPPRLDDVALLAAGYSAEGVPRATIRADYTVPNFPVADARENMRPVSPPPWPAPIAAEEGPRIHVVVDGDSLERLAATYLDDAQRNREIYELNREVLSQPDLLPIGAELKIPNKRTITARVLRLPPTDRGQGQRLPTIAAGPEAAPEPRELAQRADLVPIRAVPVSGLAPGDPPRAYLAAPMPAP
ncbi:MAG: LysM peptidoglycan-binding domain-containing protein [Pirellulales bacterium]|nr:LysM peptidoglycan-binding domain-containing protein [Pirellulales bacterium]